MADDVAEAVAKLEAWRTARPMRTWSVDAPYGPDTHWAVSLEWDGGWYEANAPTLPAAVASALEAAALRAAEGTE